MSDEVLKERKEIVEPLPGAQIAGLLTPIYVHCKNRQIWDWCVRLDSVNRNYQALEKKAAELERKAADDPELDATDGAHPAWWRGNDQGIVATADAVLKMFGEKPHSGVFGLASLNEIRAKIKTLEASQRTPGTTEICMKCGRAVGLIPSGCDIEFAHGACPIRTGMEDKLLP